MTRGIRDRTGTVVVHKVRSVRKVAKQWHCVAQQRRRRSQNELRQACTTTRCRWGSTCSMALGSAWFSL